MSERRLGVLWLRHGAGVGVVCAEGTVHGPIVSRQPFRTQKFGKKELRNYGTLRSLRVSSATLTTPIASSRAPLPTRYATIETHMRSIVRWPFYRRACLHRAAYMVNSCVCFSSSPTSKPMTILQLLATRLIRRSFAIAAASSSTATGAPSAWRVPRLWRCVAPPLRLVATSPPLAAGRPHTSPPITFDGPTLARVLRVALLS